MFKVVPDQLRISEGWVRCGHCAEVFDASAHLMDADVALPMPQAADTEPAGITEPAPIAQMPQPPATSPDLDDEPMYPPFVLRAEEPQEPIEADAPDESLPSQAPRDVREGEAAEDVSFVRQARRRAYWRRPGVRAVLLLLALGLGALFAAQYAVQERDRLAATQPALRPAIEALCQPLRCQVGPSRQIESIVIDSSTFNKLRADTYHLSFAIKNQAATPVAMPAIELTLTDTQDQPLVRRVLSPQDMGATTGQIAPLADWSATLALSVAANGGGRVAGYRLLAFYP